MATIADVLDAATAKLRITLESSVLPPITVYDGSQPDTGPGVLANFGAVLGIQGGIVIRNSNGDVLASVGTPAKFSPLRAALVLVVAAGAVYSIVQLIRAAKR
jgi:hypothetical protein